MSNPSFELRLFLRMISIKTLGSEIKLHYDIQKLEYIKYASVLLKLDE